MHLVTSQKNLEKKYDVSIIPIEVAFGEELYPEGLDTRTFTTKWQALVDSKNRYAKYI